MDWETVIGLEVHVELASETKIFCSCTTKFGGAPNTHCCPICMGMPGTLPVLNKQVLEYAVKAGLALNCEITNYNKFDRKNYFYPDLPKAYQISQLYMPFAQNGYVKISANGGKTIRIREIHMEEDAGKLIHSQDENETLLDYNRCGVPLLEIVSMPDLRSAKEATEYLEQLKLTFEYLGISDVKMEEGSMRADVNISVRKRGEEKLGTRTEMKNLNSFRAIERAVAYEVERQIGILESGGKILQETRRWDDSNGIGYPMRSKENAQDYRYFPEPNIPPIFIDEQTISALRLSLPELAHEKKQRFIKQYGLSDYEASLLTINRHFAILFEETVKLCNEPKETVNWMLGACMYFMSEKKLSYDELNISPDVFAEFIKIIKNETVNRTVGKDIFELIITGGSDFNIKEYIEENNLAQISDEVLITSTVAKVLRENPQAVEQYKAGKTKITGYIVGQAMKALKGKASPTAVNKAVAEELSKIQEDN